MAGGPWRHGGFRWFFAGEAVSLAGGSMAPVALAFAVLAASGRTSGPGDLAVVLAARSVALLACLLVGGAVADRLPRRRVLVWSNAGAALTQAAVAVLLLTGHYRLGAVAVLETLNGIGTAFTTPARRGLIPELVDAPSVRPANSALATARGATRVLGPTVAGLVVAGAGGGWAIAADAISFAVAAGCLTRLDRPADAPIAGRTTLPAELVAGWREFRGRHWVVVVVLAYCGANFVLAGVWLVLGPTIAARTVGAAGWGVVLSARAAGVLVMSLLMYRLDPRYPLRWGLAGSALFAVPLWGLGLGWATPVLAAVAAVAGAGFAVSTVTWDTSLQRHVPPAVLSRVSSYDDLGSFAAVPLGQLAAIPLSAAFGDARVALAGAGLWLLLTLGALAVRDVRDLPAAPAR